MSHGAVDGSMWAEDGVTPAGGAAPLYLFPALDGAGWWRALKALGRSLPSGRRSPRAPNRGAAADPASAGAASVADPLADTYAGLLGELARLGYSDPRRGAALVLLGGRGPLGAYSVDRVPAGLLYALERDLTTIHHVTGRPYGRLVAEALGEEQPPLSELAGDLPSGVLREAVEDVEAALAAGTPKERVELFLSAVASYGSGPTALHRALVFGSEGLVGIDEPDLPRWSELFGVEEQLARLEANVEALIARSGAQHTLLYGPRGSGKSTAVRGLLRRFEGRGLRLVEVAPAQLHAIPDLVEELRHQPTSFVLYVDDLAFDDADPAYRPLKSVLDGSLLRRPANVVVVATSNRRHLVKERLSDRPAPEDDVHGWDTHNEKLALADRFGLTITFPTAGQRDYLQLVRALAALRGVSDFPEEHALRFAQWGNGFSGRTARQFVEQLDWAPAPGDHEGS